MAHFSGLRAALPFLAGVCGLVLVAFDAAAYTSNPAGSSVITGRTNKNGGAGCNTCHGAQDTTVGVAITGPTAAPYVLSAGQSGTFTITATKSGTSGYYMGIAVAATDATSLSNFAGEPTAITNGEVIHHSGAGALRTSNGTTANYKFTFTMPGAATPGSSKTIYGLAAMGAPRAPWNHASNVTVYVPPSAPSSVTASNVTAASVDLAWSGGGTNYLVVYKTGGTAPSSTSDGTALDLGTSTSTTVSGLAQSTQYSFAVFSKISGVAVYSTSAATTTATTSTPVAAPRYVNAATGNNTGNCTSLGAPCKTITYAMAQATTGSPGDSVNVAAGTYNATLGETFPISIKSGVQLQSTGTAANTIVDATGANARVFDASGSNASTVIQGFTITGGLHLPATNSNAQGGAILIDNLAQIKVRRNIFVDNEARGYNGVAPSSPSGGVAYGGAIVSSNASPTIENNVFNSNTVRGGDGVSKFDGSAGGDGGHGHGGAVFVGGGAAIIVNNTFYANEARGGAGGSSNASSGGSGGLAFNGAVESNNANVVNNIFVNNSAAGGSGGGGSPAGSTGNSFNGALNDNGGPSTTNNLFFGNTAGSNGDTQGANAVLLDPQFHAAPTNLRILITSPAKAAGTAAGAPATDLDGTTRPAPPSIGAFEASDPTVTYNLVLEGWQQVSPYVVTSATGSGTATYNTATRALTLNLPYSGLSSTETGAHIHGPAARGANAGIYFGLAAGSPKTDTVTLTTQQETELNAGQLYVNIHTSTYGAGELRAQIDNVGATVTRALTVTKAGSGTGTVTGTAEPGTVINCGSDCAETVPNGKVVTLTAAASGGSTFTGWSGACTGTGSCPVTMDAAKTVTASFDPPVTSASADLALAQAVAPNPASAGKDVMFTMTVTNNGPATANAVTLTNPLPAGSSYVWASASCSLSSGTVTCSRSSLASGAGAVFKVVVRPAAAGSITNNAAVAASESDPASANNSVSTAVTVNSTPVAAQVLRYRLYSDVTKEHHFTTDQNEYNVLGTYVGTWVQEGTVGKVLNNPGSYNSVAAVPYYRLYDTATRWHHWTTDANEYYTLIEFSNWNAEGVDGYILPTQATSSIPLYRLLYPFIPGLHHWTIDQNEYNTLITPSYGWIGEGGSGFVIP
jgi:uncharacterized repeat protein (TIGR01451 family)